MCAGEYQTGARRLSKAQREREDARVRAEREHAEAVERCRQLEAEARRAEEEARRAARPLGVRLVEARCTVCHSADALAVQRRGRLGWWAVVARMELFNGARLASSERTVIVDHLARTQPALPAQVALEWGVALLLVSPPAALLLWRGRRRKRAADVVSPS